MSLTTAPQADPDLHAFAAELDAIRDEVRADLGADDERYLRRLLAVRRALEVGGRATILLGVALDPWWGHALVPRFGGVVALVVGVLVLAAGKILDNMEIGHNVMHGQWDWLGDPRIRGRSWEWDNACPSSHWRHFHNVVHHDWVNVLGKDRDLGFGSIRVTELQDWRIGRLAQPFVNATLALFFEWGLAIHDVQLGPIKRGEVDRAVLGRQLREIAAKVGRQAAKDYLLWPLAGGPFFLTVAAANLAANLLRNLWVYASVFCGHFPASARVYRPEEVAGESRGRWYARQVEGTCNIRGGRLLHLCTGNLSHQIEHHLFPDLPSRRYAAIAPRVADACARHGVPYHTASLARQIGSAQWKIFRLSFWPVHPAEALRTREVP